MVYYNNLETLKELRCPVEFLYSECGYYRMDKYPFVDFIDKIGSYEIYKTDYFNIMCSSDRKSYLFKDMSIRASLIKSNELVQNKDEYFPVKVSSDGKIELLDGQHRVSGMIYNGCTHINVSIKYISPDWEDFVKKLRFFYDNDGGQIYSPIEHPLFSEWKVARKPGREKIISDCSQEVRSKHGEITWVHWDIGSMSDYLCRHLRNTGLNVLGFDFNREIVTIAERLNHVFKTDIGYYHCEDFMSVLRECGDNSVGSISCISVLHHWLNQGRQEDFIEAVGLMLDKAQILFIDMDNPATGYVLNNNTTIPVDKNGFGEWLKLSGKYCKYIGECELGRPIYVASKYYDIE